MNGMMRMKPTAFGINIDFKKKKIKFSRSLHFDLFSMFPYWFIYYSQFKLKSWYFLNKHVRYILNCETCLLHIWICLRYSGSVSALMVVIWSWKPHNGSDACRQVSLIRISQFAIIKKMAPCRFEKQSFANFGLLRQQLKRFWQVI